MAELRYYVDNSGNYYVDNNNNNNFVANIIYDETPLSFIFKAHQAHIYNNGFKNYKAYIRKADGTYKRVKPHIGFYVPLSIAGIAVAGTAIANSVQ